MRMRAFTLSRSLHFARYHFARYHFAQNPK